MDTHSLFYCKCYCLWDTTRPCLSQMCNSCLVHLIFLNAITQIIFHWKVNIVNLVITQSFPLSSRLNIFLNPLHSTHPQPMFLHNEKPSVTPHHAKKIGSYFLMTNPQTSRKMIRRESGYFCSIIQDLRPVYWTSDLCRLCKHLGFRRMQSPFFGIWRHFTEHVPDVSRQRDGVIFTGRLI